MAGLAHDAVGVLGADNLWEALRLRDVRLVTTNAEHGGIGQLRLHRARVISMTRLWPVACLAIHVRVGAGAFHLQDIVVTAFTHLMPRKFHRFGRYLTNGCAAVVAVLPECARHKMSTHQNE